MTSKASMRSGEPLQLEGVVREHHRGDTYGIECEVGAHRQNVIARRGGRLIKNHIRLIPGDRVVVEVSPYDTTRGRVVRRIDQGVGRR